MKTARLLAYAWFITLLPATTPAHASPRDAQWKEVDQAMGKGLPKTAIERLAPIIEGALRDHAWGEAAKAIARRIVLESNIQGNKPEEKITRLEAEITRAPKELVPLFDTILADWYWQYFQRNRWRFLRRTATAQAPGKDFTTWDLPRLFAEIDRRFQKALAAGDTLRRTPVSAFDDLLRKGALPDAYRPTLYDIIAQEALTFYTSGEQAAAKPQDAFELAAEGPVFDPADAFLKWHQTLATKELPESPILRALQLYGELLRFHRDDTDPTAFIDVDLARLVYGHNVAVGETKNARYQAALKTFVDRWADHPVAALALFHWAQVVREDGDPVEARKVALRGAQSHPDSPGGRLCHNLIQEIEARSLAVSTERVWSAPLPKVVLRYRNLTRVCFRVVAWDWNEFLNRKHGRPEWLNDNDRKELQARKPVLEWSSDLPPTPDFKERVQELPAPDTLKPGFYFLVASHDAAFGENDNQVTYADFWVSDLALIVRPSERNLEGFVLEAGSGEPIPDAEVMAWYLDNQGNRVPNGPAVRTDDNGLFSIPGKEGRGSLVRARCPRGGTVHELGSMQEYGLNAAGRAEVLSQTIFFTDRALYRPGQTVQYKGICLRANQENDDYTVLGGQKLTVMFADPNGKEIARAQHQCNDYGSFSGSFTAPHDRLTGQMHLSVVEGPVGAGEVSVEEYKRPKFQVTLDAPKTAARLNDKVLVPGKAESYTGAAVDGALVSYRVVREVRWPYWWGWYRRSAPRVAGSQEIAHGTSRSGTDGSFQVEFLAKPDPKVSEKDEASFTFTVHADVTDPAGETRSAQRGVQVGFTALQAVLSAGDWQTADRPVELALTTTTLDGEPQQAEGSLKVHRLKEPAQVHRPPLGGRYWPVGPEAEDGSETDLSDPNHWELGDVVAERGFTTDAEGKQRLDFKLGVGLYRAMLETQDRFGKRVTARLPIQVLNPADTRLTLRIPHLLAAPDWTVEPGAEFVALWGTGYDTGRAFVEVEHRGKMTQRYWTKPGETQVRIRQAVTEAMRGGFTLHVTRVRENRAYLDSRRIDVPWSNKQLEISWEHFTSKLEPNQKETWTALIQHRNPKAETRQLEKAVAEMVATLYDASLDAFRGHAWPGQFGVFRQDHSFRHADFANVLKALQHLKGTWRSDYRDVAMTYRSFPPEVAANLRGYGAMTSLRMSKASQADGLMRSRYGLMAESAEGEVAFAAPAAAPADAGIQMDRLVVTGSRIPGGGAGAEEPATPAVDLGQVTARKNLNETAFFFPQLTSDSNGVVRLTFTMPEALTTWRFMGFAHDRSLRSGYLEGKTVTAKDIMVQPNPPRFLREGDAIRFTVKVSNQSAARQIGKLRLSFALALDGNPVDRELENRSPEVEFDIPAKESRSFSWRIHVPDGMGFLTYKTVGSTGRLSDGEEGYLPVLSRRIAVTESLPLPIRGPATKKFEFTRLLQSGRSDTLRHEGLTVQMVSNPAWYAIMALPYLMEFPHECTEQTFNRFYANTLARFVANSDPKVRRVFDQWKGTPSLDSPLEKNQDLKRVMIEETPWLRQAQAESQARRNVGVLFDDNRLNYETERTLRQLTEAQLADGSWPWFPGGRGNDYITLYIATGFGRLRHLGVDVRVDPAIKALNRLDTWMDEHYREIQKHPKPEDYVPSSTDALYLYARSFFLKDFPIRPHQKAAIDFFLAQARRHWLQVNCRLSQGHLALALKRWGGEDNLARARDIMKSIKERSVTDDELGRFWRDTELSWWWYRAPIETQALMIEAFDEVMSDAQAVEDCRIWLLKQKQTQDWKTTKATADAVYGLLLRGRDFLASDRLVEVAVGGVNITPQPGVPTSGRGTPPEAGTGFYEKRFAPAEIKPKLGEITVKKVDAGVAWGSVHWQYLEDVSKITPYAGTPLKLNKAVFVKRNTTKGPVLEPVRGPLAVGDELVVRIELRVDRDMEYVHLKDQRGSGTEPVNVLSGYRYQDGLAYYESTRDTASHFFIDYLPKGTYVFEYSTRIQLAGEYQTGLAEIQCMYAPEFNSHSASLLLQVR